MPRLRRFLARPDVRRAPVRFVARRLLYELQRRLSPRRLERERIARLDDGAVIALRLDDRIERNIWLYGAHDYDLLEVFRLLLAPGMVVIDVGAHVGQFTLSAAARVGAAGHVIAVEPNPEILPRLEGNVRRNGFSWVSIVAAAVAESPGRALLRLPETAGDNTGAASIEYGGPAASAFEVAVETLDRIVRTFELPRLDVVKVDAEGSEARVFDGGRDALARWKPHVLFEADDLLFGREKGGRAVDRLRGLGYRIYGRVPQPGKPLLEPLRMSDLGRYRTERGALNLMALHPDRLSEYRALLG